MNCRNFAISRKANLSIRRNVAPNRCVKNRLRSATKYARSVLGPTAQLNLIGAFEDFLSSYKSTVSTEDISATDALQDLNIEDGLSDEYDFMEDARDEEGKEKNSRSRKFADPKKKYMNMLQQVADRQISEVTIELDDLENVSYI